MENKEMKTYEIKLSRAEVSRDVCKWIDDQIKYTQSTLDTNKMSYNEYKENNPNATAENDWHIDSYIKYIEKMENRIKYCNEIIEFITNNF